MSEDLIEYKHGLYSIKLELCPFCKGEAISSKNKNGFFIQCKKCGGRTAYHKNEENAITHWNKRG